MDNLILKCGEKKYALPINQVEHIIQTVKIESVPNSSANVLGVINFHGEMIIVFDLESLISNSSNKSDLVDTATIICNLNGLRFALLVDSVDSVKEFSGKIASINGAQVIQIDLGDVIDQEMLNV